MSHIYVSHSLKDINALLKLDQSLRDLSIPLWFRTEASNEKDIEAAIDKAFAMILLVSANSVRSGAVKKEIKRAKAIGLKLIPYQIDKARLNGFFKSNVLPLLKLSETQESGFERLMAESQLSYKRKCPVISVMNLKGGTGKTTISAQVFGAWQSAIGGRILLVDLDPQYNLTQTFLDMDVAEKSATGDKSVISLFERSQLHARDVRPPAENWHGFNIEPFAPPKPEALAHDLLGPYGPAGRLDLISGQFEISKYAFSNDTVGLETIKENFLRMIDLCRSQYDLIVFDTNPNATFLTKCILEAADRVLAPIHPDIYSLHGVKLLYQIITQHISSDLQPRVSVLFNNVRRTEQSTFEADAYNGVYNTAAGFDLKSALMTAALPNFAQLKVRKPVEEALPYQQLLIHNGHGGGLKTVRESLKSIAFELKEIVQPSVEVVSA